jgi:hypothetical protein
VKQIKAELYVDCPPAQAHRHLDAFFSDHPKMTFRLPVVPGAEAMFALERQVTISVERQKRRPEDFDRLNVTWGPAGGGPFPVFEGTIEVEADDDYNSFRLVLSGSYVPPLGIAGKAFDFVVGRRIAIATARDLLAKMRTQIERSFHELEAAKVVRLAAAT